MESTATDNRRLKIGVVGGGISGITAAWLLSKQHKVTLLEREPRLGGHAYTHVMAGGPDDGMPVDMGFIVLNDRTYPTLHALFKQWNVRVQASDMAFGFDDKPSGFYYSSDLPGGLFARRRNLVSLRFWQVIRDIFRFNRVASQTLQAGCHDMTLGQFLDKHGFSEAYRDFHIVPVSAAVWSTPAANILEFPAESILRFYDHHGLLSLTDRPQWQTVVGGSTSYVTAFERLFNGTVKTASPVTQVKRTAQGIQVICDTQNPMTFDCVVLATHADISHQLLENPTSDEDRILSQWSYTQNHVCLNTDVKVLPPRRGAWASWNYTRFTAKACPSVMTMSYYMNRLQRLNSTQDYLVTLNGEPWIDSDHVIESVVFDHPCYTFDSLNTHAQMDTINGKDRIFFCGAYCGYGFHEDGARSGLDVARKFGIEL